MESASLKDVCIICLFIFNPLFFLNINFCNGQKKVKRKMLLKDIFTLFLSYLPGHIENSYTTNSFFPTYLFVRLPEIPIIAIYWH